MMAEDAETKSEKAEDKNGHRTRLAKTLLINLAFMLSLGMCEASRGPALLDLTEIYETSVGTISVMSLVFSVGSLFGSFFTGWIMDRKPGWNCVTLFWFTFLHGAAMCFQPHCGNLYAFFVLQFVLGFMGGSLDTGGNVLCLYTWRGRDSGPYMHSIHFSYSVGAFIAPVLISPFLSTKNDYVIESNGSQSTDLDYYLTGTQLGFYFPMLGLVSIVVSTGFLYFGIQDLRANETHHLKTVKVDEETSSACPNTCSKMTLVTLLAFFFFLYAGMEYTYAMYLTTFAVSSPLALTKAQGVELTALFYGTFAAMRFLAIFAAVKLNPLVIMVFSCGLCLSGAGALVVLAERSFLALQVLTAVLGVGMASMYATGLLWLERRVLITSALGATLSIAGSAGPDVFPLVVGQFIESAPMSLVHLVFGIITSCTVVFGVACHVGRRVKQEKGRQEKDLVKP